MNRGWERKRGRFVSLHKQPGTVATDDIANGVCGHSHELRYIQLWLTAAVEDNEGIHSSKMTLTHCLFWPELNGLNRIYLHFDMTASMLASTLQYLKNSCSCRKAVLFQCYSAQDDTELGMSWCDHVIRNKRPSRDFQLIRYQVKIKSRCFLLSSSTAYLGETCAALKCLHC